MDRFEDLKLSEQLMNAINRLNFNVPTLIQKETIPLILKGKDIIGESATGSGKTLAFGAGIVDKCNPGEGIQAVVLLPTRELAEQVKDEIIKISYKKPLKVFAIYGGISINPQINNLRRADVVIATPGRFLDHMERRTIDTSKVKILVLDEADRMVEMGFIEDVERIIRACPKNRQTLLFSATMYGPAKEIAMRYMKEPITVHATKMVDPSKLKQTYYETPSNLKKELLAHLLQKDNTDLSMVFCNTRRATEMLVKALKLFNVKSVAIHGGMTQVKRLRTIELFHEGKFNTLICTDVAARGLHIEGVTHIYNYDLPREAGDYVHRIGRTARAGKKGLVVNVLSPRDHDSFSRILRTYRTYEIIKVERPYLKPGPKSEYSPRDDSPKKRYGNDAPRGRGNFPRGRYGNDAPRERSQGRDNSRGGSGGYSRGPSRDSRPGSNRRDSPGKKRPFSRNVSPDFVRRRQLFVFLAYIFI